MTYWWTFARKFPKYALVIGLIAGSSIAFYFWQVTHRARRIANLPTVPGIVEEDLGPKMAKVEANHERMLLVDNDLYDIENGELVFKDWLKRGMPGKLFWEPDSKTVLAQYELGFVRYNLDGTVQASLPLKYPFGFSHDYRWIVFSKDKDIWRADVEWKSLKLVNEGKVTSIGQFNDQNFAANIAIGTDKTLIVRNMNQLLRVNLETGDVHPIKLPLLEIAKRRSPDSKSVVGLQNGQFYCYDVDTDETKSIQIGRGAITDYQWLDNDRCAAVAGGAKVILYDRKRNSLSEVVPLPVQCPKIGEPSPDGRFVFCYNWKGGDLVDLEKKTATPLKGGAGIAWVSNDTFAFFRDVPDSDMRGTWLQKAGEGERRVSPEPYLVSNAGGVIMTFRSAGLVVFATKQGIVKMKADAGELAEVAKLATAPRRLRYLEEWVFK